MSIKSKAFNFFQNIYTSIPKIIPGYLGKKFRAESAEKLVVIDEVKTKYGLLRYYCMGWLPIWRSKTLFTKEPETISWIDAMDKNDILWDIGSNVGLYSVYAGLKGMKVFAFEPSALNTFFISKNIEINNLKDNVSLFPVAISDRNEFGYLNMSSTDLGGAFNEFNETNLKTVGEDDYKKPIVFKQGMFAYSMDELIEKYKFETPGYIKIDVDSIEDRIVYGGSKTLANKKVKGLLLELVETEDRTQKIIDFLAERGLTLKEKKHSELMSSGKFKNFFNYIFERI
tara:strand:+ start:771 stop:1625 length:855 start_codon:yes stop_codon:yes gene_type:complete